MRLAQIGYRIRQGRLARGLTQARLAQDAGIARATLNQFENGLARDLGIAKVLRLLEAVGLEIIFASTPSRRPADYLAVAATAASVGFREALTEDQLLKALLTGKIPDKKRPHFRRLLEDSPPELIGHLTEQVGAWAKRGRVERNLLSIAKVLEVEPQTKWTRAG